MPTYFALPLTYLRFWYLEAPREIILYFFSLNSTFLQEFSLILLLRTFFQPIKNEYREGLIWFSIGMGMFVKFWIILVDIVILIVLLAIEIFIISAFLLWPVATIYLLIL